MTEKASPGAQPPVEESEAGIITVTVKCDLDYDEIFGRVHVQTTLGRTLDWVMDEFCREKKVTKKDTFALRTEDGTDLKLMNTLAASNLNDGALIYAYNKDPPKPPKDVRERPTFNMFYVVALIAFLLAIVGLLIMFCLWYIPAGARSAESSYGVLIDAGSTSSKVYLYRWPRYFDKRNNVAVQEVARCKKEPGISSYTDDPLDSAIQIQNCLSSVILISLNKSTIAKTGLYLGATAGMRMMQYSHPNGTRAIFNNLRTQLPKSNLQVDNVRSQIRIITGMEEGYNAWITTNYVLDNFGNMSETSGLPISKAVAPEDTYGALDLGGASTQITFVPSKSDLARAPLEYISELNLFGGKYPVYSHSFLCYGKSMVEKRVFAILARDANFTTTIDDPCLPIGYNKTFVAKEIFYVPCVMGRFARGSYGYDIIPPPRIDMETTKFTFRGTSNPDKCRKSVSELFNTTAGCPYPSCSFNKIFQPKVRGKYYAFAGFYYVMNYLNLTKVGLRPAADYPTFRKAVDDLCKKPLIQVPKVGLSDSVITGYCFDGIYINNLLNLYGFNETNWNTIEFVEKVAGFTIGWSLGFILELTGHQSIDSGKFITFTSFIVPLILFIILLIVGVIFLVLALRQKKSRTRFDADGNSVNAYGATW